MAGSTIRVWLKEFEESNDLKYVSPYSLRHTFITMLIDNGVGVKTASTMAIHKKVQITLDTYTRRTSKRDSKAAEVIGKVLRCNE